MVDFDSDIDVGDDVLGSSLAGPIQPVAGKTIATKFVQVILPVDIAGTAIDFATEAKQDTEITSLASIDGKINYCDTDSVSVASSALPSGAATSAKQDTIIGHVDGIEGALTTLNAKDFATETTLASLLAKSDRSKLGSNTPTAYTTTSISAFVTADASYKLDLTSVTLNNESATDTVVVIYDDDGTTERWRGSAKANDMRGIVFGKDNPLLQTAVNKTWKAKTVTAVSTLYISAQFIKN